MLEPVIKLPLAKRTTVSVCAERDNEKIQQKSVHKIYGYFFFKIVYLDALIFHQLFQKENFWNTSLHILTLYIIKLPKVIWYSIIMLVSCVQIRFWHSTKLIVTLFIKLSLITIASPSEFIKYSTIKSCLFGKLWLQTCDSTLYCSTIIIGNHFINTYLCHTDEFGSADERICKWHPLFSNSGCTFIA